MDKFHVLVRPEGYPERYQGDLVIQAVINGHVVKDDDYCLDIDTFFSAIGKDGTTIVSLLGSCADKGCCGEGFYTFPNAECWNWGWDDVEYRLSWSDVLLAAMQIIVEIEKLASDSGFAYKELHPRLPFYYGKLDELKRLMGAQDTRADTV